MSLKGCSVFWSNTDPHTFVERERHSLLGCLPGPQIRLLIHNNLIDRENSMAVTRGERGGGRANWVKGPSTWYQEETKVLVVSVQETTQMLNFVACLKFT